MRILLAGDIHGDLDHAGYLVQMALNNDCKVICVVGDFGYWPHTDPLYLTKLSRTLKKRGISLFFVDGNHEAFWLRPDAEKPNRVGLTQLDGKPRTPEGFITLSDSIFYIPRGLRWKWGDTVFLGLGGAPSVDKDWRLEVEQEGTETSPPTGHKTRWWPEELITLEDVERAIECIDPELADVKVMITHDIPAGSYNFLSMKNGWEFDQNRRYLKTVVDAVRPNVLVHGHYHHKRDEIFRMGEGWPVRVIGLNRNTTGDESWIILEA